MLVIATFATTSYLFAMREQLPMLVANIRYAEYKGPIAYVFCTDDNPESEKVFQQNSGVLGRMGIECFKLVVKHDGDGGNQGHGHSSNKIIAALQGAAFEKARELDADFFWSLESDILPQAASLRVCMDTLSWDKGFYDVCMSTYWNGGFLGGNGTPQEHICPNVYEDERKLTAELRSKIRERNERQARLAKQKQRPSPRDIKKWVALRKAIESCTPEGNVFFLNGKSGWRPRGWLQDAHPGVGYGGLLHTYWIGMGCTVFSRRALSMCNFTGYDGGGTQDLYLGWRVLQPKGVRMAVTTHAVCSHVKPIMNPKAPTERQKDKKGNEMFVVWHASHNSVWPYTGHLTVEKRPFNAFTPSAE